MENQKSYVKIKYLKKMIDEELTVELKKMKERTPLPVSPLERAQKGLAQERGWEREQAAMLCCVWDGPFADDMGACTWDMGS